MPPWGWVQQGPGRSNLEDRWRSCWADCYCPGDPREVCAPEGRCRPHPTPAPLAAEKLIRPKVQVRDGVIEEEAWEYFVHRWTTYKSPLSSKLSVGNTSLQNTKKYKVLSPNVLGCLPSPNRTKSYKSDRSLQISFLVMRGRKDHLQYLPQFSVKKNILLMLTGSFIYWTSFVKWW